jgi:hypothetical protein
VLAGSASRGKLHPGEDAFAGLVSELREELGVEVHAAERLIQYSHAYPERIVRLDMWTVTDWSGEPRGLDGQALKWVPRRNCTARTSSRRIGQSSRRWSRVTGTIQVRDPRYGAASRTSFLITCA